MATDPDEAAAEATEKRTGIPKLTTMLSCAISSWDYEKVRRLLSETGVDVNRVNVYGYTPLFSAVYVGYTPIARLLIENGGDVNNPGETHYSPLMFAVIEGNLDMVKMLLAKGADINARDRMYGENVLHYALRVRDTNMARFLLSIKPELATEPDNAGNLPDLTGVNMEGIHPDTAPLSAARRMGATALLSRRAADLKRRAEAHAARDARFKRDIEEYYTPSKAGGRRRQRKTVKARKTRKAAMKRKRKTMRRHSVRRSK